MAAYDLTTLAAVKAWLGIDASVTASDTLLAALISAASRWTLSYLSRGNILQASYADYYDGSGYGQNRVLLRRWPVLSISLVMVGAVAVPAGTRPTPTNQTAVSGYLLEPWSGIPPGRMQALDFFGYCVPSGRQNVQVSYSAGYAVLAETAAVPPSPGPYTVTAAQLYGAWAQDGGVTYADGAALVKVSAAPAAGEYSVDAETGKYTFAAADAGAAVLLTYSYVPSDLAQACMELVSERFKYRSRIGEASKTLGGQETVTYSQKDMTEAISQMLQNYKQVVPI